MKIFKLLSLVASLAITSSLFSQKIELYENQKYPAEPVGGKKEINLLVKQSIVYPEHELKNKIEGDVFVLFKVDSLGNIFDLETRNSETEGLKNEATRLVQLILWEPNENRQRLKIGVEKIKISFSIKKYLKIEKKRKAENLDLETIYFTGSKIYMPLELDSVPQPMEYSSITDFINKNMKYPSLALQQGISGKVTIQFVIEPYGKITNVKLINAVAGGCNEETVRLMRAINWKPGKKEDKFVRTLFEYSLNFNHSGGSFK